MKVRSEKAFNCVTAASLPENSLNSFGREASKISSDDPRLAMCLSETPGLRRCGLRFSLGVMPAQSDGTSTKFELKRRRLQNPSASKRWMIPSDWGASKHQQNSCPSGVRAPHPEGSCSFGILYSFCPRDLIGRINPLVHPLNF